MTLKQIIENYMRDNGYDGMAGEQCGCGLDDFMPCDNPQHGCVPAMRHTCKDCTVKTEGCDEMADAEVNSGCWKPAKSFESCRGKCINTGECTDDCPNWPVEEKK